MSLETDLIFRRAVKTLAEQQLTDHEVFMQAAIFLQSLTPDELSSTLIQAEGVIEFLRLLQSLSLSDRNETSARQVQERAGLVQIALDYPPAEASMLRGFYHQEVRIRATSETRGRGLAGKLGYVREINNGKLLIKLDGLPIPLLFEMSDVELSL